MDRLLTVIVLLPLAGFLLNGLLGNRLGKRFVSVVGCGLPIARLCRRDCLSAGLARERVRAAGGDRLYLGRHRRPLVRDLVLLRSPHGGDGVDRDRGRLADPHLLHRLHEGRHELRPLLRVPEPVPLLHAAARPGPVAAGALRRLGRRRARIVSVDRLLVRRSRQGARRQEGLPHQPHRRCWLPARHVRAVPGAGNAGNGQDQRGVHERAAAGGVREPGRHPPVHRRLRQVGADPAPCLVAGRDGRSDAGLGVDPCRDDGDRRRLSGRAPVRRLHARAGGVRGDRRGRRDDGVFRGDDRARADRHQEGARVLDDLAARPHVRRAGRGRLRRRHLPPLHARVLQGVPVPGRRQRDPCAGRRAGHHQDGRARAEDPDHLCDVRHRDGRHRRDSTAGRLFLQGRDPLVRVREQFRRIAAAVRGSRRHRAADRALHVPVAVAARSSARRA